MGRYLSFYSAWRPCWRFAADGPHPGEAGYKLMGDAIDLSLFN
ncbi:hypothetical protein [Sphingobium sp. Leaf26]|nr:hypothetical protein [Sphingobium sp. Leaf26]